MESQTIDKTDNELNVYFQIDDGFRVRHVFGAINLIITDVNMIFKREKILISFLDETGQGYHKITFDTSKFRHYEFFEPEFSADSGSTKYKVGFDVEEMVTATKGITKQDGVIIYQEKDSHAIVLNPQKSALKDPDRNFASFVKIKPVEQNKPNKFIYSKNFSFKAQTKDFCDFCNSSVSRKCVYVEMTAYEQGAELISYTKEGSRSTTITYGTIDKNNTGSNQISQNQKNFAGAANIRILPPSVIATVNIPIKIIKALSKFVNFSDKNSYIFFTVEKDDVPIRITADIGSFGKYELLLLCKTNELAETNTNKKKGKR